MASSPQKSPSSPKSPSSRSPPSRKKDDSFLGKLGGTLARRKKAKEDIVNCDLKSTLRVLYNLFTKYRNVE
ncbi:Alpha-parvin [Bagarius yarrelli]|uniref:Alpha-parvin n=1 Tax=Bagarius yarrelli TaxID=175774 RepID=A0A556U0U9_BAGYA|nr:Alpha-parvin [Bagarius yarrelli]